MITRKRTVCNDLRFGKLSFLEIFDAQTDPFWSPVAHKQLKPQLPPERVFVPLETGCVDPGLGAAQLAITRSCTATSKGQSHGGGWRSPHSCLLQGSFPDNPGAPTQQHPHPGNVDPAVSVFCDAGRLEPAFFVDFCGSRGPIAKSPVSVSMHGDVPVPHLQPTFDAFLTLTGGWLLRASPRRHNLAHLGEVVAITVNSPNRMSLSGPLGNVCSPNIRRENNKVEQAELRRDCANGRTRFRFA